MAPIQRHLIERNIRPRKRSFSESDDSEGDHLSLQDSPSEREQRGQEENGENYISNTDDSDSNSEHDNGKRLQTSLHPRAKLKFRHEQNAKPDGRRGMVESESEVEELDGWRTNEPGWDRDQERQDHNVKLGLGQISFGALKRAQDALDDGSDRQGLRKKRKQKFNQGAEEALQKLRGQLKAKREQPDRKDNGNPHRQVTTNAVKTASQDDTADDSDSDSAPSEEEAAPSTSRTSKHAPASQTTKRQVSRKRQVIDVPKIHSRDPRFDAFHLRNSSSSSSHPNNTAAEKAYGFLVDYQKSEIAELKVGLKRAKTVEDKEVLKRKIVAMENRLKSKEAKERQQEVVRRHRKEEKAMIEQGKKPFYLKKSELKERALVERFKGMKGKEKEKAIEKKRKKEGQKEKKRMPNLRRGV